MAAFSSFDPPSWVAPDPASTAPNAPRPVAGPVVDFPTLTRRRDAGEQGAALVLVHCAPPRGVLESTAVSALVPPMPAGITHWEAFWSDDDGYVLRAVRDAAGAREEWFTLAVAAGAPSRAPAAGYDVPEVAPAHSSGGAPVARLHTVLVGWRPNGSGAARWSVASRRA